MLRTGSFEFEAASGVYTELPCGSSIFMDADYGKNRDRDGEPTKAFEPGLFVCGKCGSGHNDLFAAFTAECLLAPGRTAQRESSGESYYRVANPSNCYAAVFAGRADTG